MRTLLLLIAILGLPLSASAQKVVLGGLAPAKKTLEEKVLVQLAQELVAAFVQAGMEVVPLESRQDLEFITSFTVSEEGEELVVVAQTARFQLDRWSARSEVRASAGDADARTAALAQLAGAVQQAVAAAPPRDPSMPERTARAAPQAE